MDNKKANIRTVVSWLNNEEADGGFWLPNIQRPFVWSEEQICRLFDSILRQYPISTLLIWKTKSGIKRRKFIDNWKPDIKLSDPFLFVPANPRPKHLVLDGQQRLQSLFIGLKGSYEGRELYFHVLSGKQSEKDKDDVKYRFAFLPLAKASFPWVRFKDLVKSNALPHKQIEELKTLAGRSLQEDEQDTLGTNVAVVARAFKQTDAIAYQELDSIEDESLYAEDDVVEVFIRANSGGTKLGKSDLLFSLLAASWEDADTKMDELLESLNKNQFAFDRDFVLKTCLILLGHGARYEVSKFRKEGVREEIESRWGEISRAMQDVIDFVRGKTFIHCDRALPSHAVLMPLIYLRFHRPKVWSGAQDRDVYIVRTLLAGTFSGNSDAMLDALVSHMKEAEAFRLEEVFEVIRSKGRSLELTEERFWAMGYGSSTIHLLLNLWYPRFSYDPAYENNLPQVDHVFAESILKSLPEADEETGRRNRLKYPAEKRNQLANCMLLTCKENGAGGKSGKTLEEWFADKPESDLDLHLIPKDRALWSLDRFDDFIEERKKLIRKKFEGLLVAPREAVRQEAIESRS